jgi:hypothetical protein
MSTGDFNGLLDNREISALLLPFRIPLKDTNIDGAVSWGNRYDLPSIKRFPMLRRAFPSLEHNAKKDSLGFISEASASKLVFSPFKLNRSRTAGFE